jgi:hypothetical protein
MLNAENKTVLSGFWLPSTSMLNEASNQCWEQDSPVAPKRCDFSPRRATPISHHGNVNEIIGKFGGADQLRNAVNQLQSLLYAV